MFIAASIASLTYITFAALNYMRYYPAVGELYTDVSRVAVQRDLSSNTTTVHTSVVVGNPSDYSGFSLYSDQITVFFLAPRNGSTVLQDQPVSATLTGSRPLGPHSAITTDLPIELTPDQVSLFSTFNQTFSGGISARVRVLVQVDSFLDPVAGRITFEKLVYIPLS